MIRGNMIALLATSVLAVATIDAGPGVPRILVPTGERPVIDGAFGEGEWDDAERVALGADKTMRLKHDGRYLYLGLDGDGGTLYFRWRERLRVLHSSFSLCSAEYVHAEGSQWKRQQDYELALLGLQEEAASKVQESLREHLKRTGWVASLIPMGTSTQTEFAISLEWLVSVGEPMDGPSLTVPAVLISSAQNLPPAERKGKDVRLRWPPGEKRVRSLDQGRAPESIGLSTDGWGQILVELRD